MFSSLLRRASNRSSDCLGRCGRGVSTFKSRFAPLVETLEDRMVPATIQLSSDAPLGAVFGQPVNLIATVRGTLGVECGPGHPLEGTVNFWRGSTFIGQMDLPPGGWCESGVSLPVPPIPRMEVGNHEFTAQYMISARSSFTQMVVPANTSLEVASSPNPSVYGDLVTIDISVSAEAPGAGDLRGVVSLYDGEILLGTAVVNSTGQAVYRTRDLDLGEHWISASYENLDESFNPSYAYLVHEVEDGGAFRGPEAGIVDLLLSNQGPRAKLSLAGPSVLMPEEAIHMESVSGAMSQSDAGHGSKHFTEDLTLNRPRADGDYLEQGDEGMFESGMGITMGWNLMQNQPA